MSSWGFRTFEDDIACDWLEDLHDSDPIAFFVKCLDLSGLDYLDFLACVGVVCTSEMLRVVVSGPQPGLPEIARQWCEEYRELNCQSLLPQAVAGMKRILKPHSEMWVRWEDHDELFEFWLSHQKELIRDLQAAIPATG